MWLNCCLVYYLVCFSWSHCWPDKTSASITSRTKPEQKSLNRMAINVFIALDKYRVDSCGVAAALPFVPLCCPSLTPGPRARLGVPLSCAAAAYWPITDATSVVSTYRYWKGRGITVNNLMRGPTCSVSDKASFQRLKKNKAKKKRKENRQEEENNKFLLVNSAVQAWSQTRGRAWLEGIMNP